MAEAFAMFGAGCFWGVEHRFRQVEGVLDAESGYSGGETANPTYEQVCTDTTGHAEVVRVRFDPERVSYEALVRLFFSSHNPTQLNRQGPDIGRQYRSAMFTYSDEQRETAERVKAEVGPRIEAERGKPVVTEIGPAGDFYRAEEYHQRYYEKTGGAGCGL